MPTGLLALPSIAPNQTPSGALRAANLAKPLAQVGRGVVEGRVGSTFRKTLAEAKARPVRDDGSEKRTAAEQAAKSPVRERAPIRNHKNDDQSRSDDVANDHRAIDAHAADSEDVPAGASQPDAIQPDNAAPSQRNVEQSSDDSTPNPQDAGPKDTSQSEVNQAATTLDAVVVNTNATEGVSAGPVTDVATVAVESAPQQPQVNQRTNARQKSVVERSQTSPHAVVEHSTRSTSALSQNDQLNQAAKANQVGQPRDAAAADQPSAVDAKTPADDASPEQPAHTKQVNVQRSLDAQAQSSVDASQAAIDQLNQSSRRANPSPVIANAAPVVATQTNDAAQTSDVSAIDETGDPDETQATSRPGAGRTTRPNSAGMRSVIDRQDRSSPAVSRALEVDMAVHLENATGQPQNSDGASRSQIHPMTSHSQATVTTSTVVTEAPAANLPTPTPQMDDAPLANRVVRGLTAMVNQRGGVMNMRLTPPELGDLRVQMTLTRGVVSAEFQANSPQAQVMLERNLAVLRTALENQGLTVDRLVVHTAPLSGQQMARDDGNTSQGHAQSQRHNHDAAGGESRGRQEDAGHDSQRHHRRAEFSSLFDESEMFDWRAGLAASRG